MKDHDHALPGTLAVLMVILYVVFFSLGLGAVPWCVAYAFDWLFLPITPFLSHLISSHKVDDVGDFPVERPWHGVQFGDASQLVVRVCSDGEL
jgi:hypothetical protein